MSAKAFNDSTPSPQQVTRLPKGTMSVARLLAGCSARPLEAARLLEDSVDAVDNEGGEAMEVEGYGVAVMEPAEEGRRLERPGATHRRLRAVGLLAGLSEPECIAFKEALSRASV